MTSIETKRAIASDVLDLLTKYPAHHQLIVDLVQSFSGLGQASRITSPPKPAAPKEQAKAKSVETKSQPAKEENKKDEYIDPRAINDSKKQCNLVQALLQTDAKRQAGASAPRMDHKSIRARASSARKKLRSALKDLKSSSSETADHIGKVSDFVNATKSFRLVFRDAHKAGTTVNIGVDLLQSFPSLEEWKTLVSTLEKSSFILDKATCFWHPPSESHLDPPDPSPRNPFSSDD